MSFIPKEIEPFPVNIVGGPYEGRAGIAVNQYRDGVFGVIALDGTRAFAKEEQLRRITAEGPPSQLTKLESMDCHELASELRYWVEKVSKIKPEIIADLVEGSGDVDAFLSNSAESMKNSEGEAEVIETIKGLMEDADV